MSDLHRAAERALLALELWEDSLNDTAAIPGLRFERFGAEAIKLLTEALKKEKESVLLEYTEGLQHGKDLAEKDWVGLTDREVLDICVSRCNENTFSVVHAVEQKLREKNR